MQPLSGLDASFLYLETPTSHMHVGGVAVLEGSLKFEEFRDLLASRIHLSPKMRQRLIQVPLSIDYPYWADDPNFDINLHLQHLALPQPGAWRQLRDLASSIFSKPLDRSRPLWEFTFVEGLDNIPQVPAGSVAIIGKIHHAAVDGVAGADLLALLFDLTPEPRKVKPPEPFKPAPLPNEITVATQSAINFAKKPLKLPSILKDTVSATLKAGFLTRVQNIDLPAVPFTAPATPLNGIISAQRKWNAAILSLERVKVLKNIMGTTLNDVMLAICSGALRRYLLDKDKLPHKPLVAMVPISVRAPGDEEKTGNQISSMLVQLATHIEDPLERLETVHENAIRGKMYQGAIGARTLAKMAEVVPFGLANQATRLYSRFQVAEMHNPIFNVVITNVPGPQFPLYMNGRKLLAHMGMAPIIDGMGLIITIFSYNGLITVSPTSDANTMPDMDVF
ncbi:MAG: wax ester/triacylglycerol synthase family O-acyltransferase, partial [Anaerolineales bacterium]|nr:wax ester/triacylglycerol synthase family O-acyltransferase [Anaerolineales bacterium]